MGIEHIDPDLPVTAALFLLLQECHQLWGSHGAGGPGPTERLVDTAGAAARHDVLYPLPLAAGILPAALPAAGRQQTLSLAWQ